MSSKLEHMVQLQHRLNQQINSEWVTAGFAWHRAAWLEAAELVEHIGWKWWEASAPNFVQAQIELVDIWHFVLSDYIVHHGTAAAKILEEELNDPDPKVTLYRGQLRRLDELSILETAEVFAGQAAIGVVSARMFDALRQSLDMTWDGIYTMYVAKNVLNIFRQDNGYKDGRYVKNWLGEEDNVFLEKVLSANKHLSFSELYATLQKRYGEVLQAQV